VGGMEKIPRPFEIHSAHLDFKTNREKVGNFGEPLENLLNHL